MTLKQFLDMWTRKNLTIILSKSQWYDEMFDLVDDINEGKKKISEIQEHIICGIVPYYSQYIEEYYIKDCWMDARVTNFYIGTTTIIIWIEEGETE